MIDISNPIISVITPVFNGAKHIERCINNVAAQRTHATEHVIVDGGSTDGTLEIIKRATERHPHIRWISERDKGQYDAFNKGIALARGSVITSLNVDDFYTDGALKKAQEMVSTLPAPFFLVGNCVVKDQEGKVLYINKPSHLSLKDLLLGWHVHQFPVNPSAYFYSKSIHDVVGLYDGTDQIAFDLAFILKVAERFSMTYVDYDFGNFIFAPGTKTWEDQKKGASKKRYATLMLHYLKTLSYPERLHIWFKKLYGNNWKRACNNASTQYQKHGISWQVVAVFLLRLFDIRPFYYR